mgnify:CR=1 FL=1
MRAVFLDIETTGLDPLKHKIIDIAFFVIDLSTQKKRMFYQSVIHQSQDVWDLRDVNSTEFNGFTFAEVAEGKNAETVFQEIKQIFDEYQIKRGSSFFICQNPAFDRTFFSQLVSIPLQENFQWPYHWLDLASMYFALKFKDSLHHNIPFPEDMSLSKNNIAERFNIPPENKPHKAAGGVRHLLQCFEALFNLHFTDF